MPDYFGMLGGAIGIGYNTMNSIIGNEIAYDYASKYAGLNYEYNEKAAENAKKRQIELYNMLASPKALREQYKEAGLSPSLMFGGGGPGGQASTAPMGAGASGMNSSAYGVDPVNLAQISLMQAEARKANAEAATEEGENERGKLEIQSLLKKIDSQTLTNDWQAYENSCKAWETAIKSATAENEIKLSELNLKTIAKRLEILEDEARSTKVKADVDEETKEDVIKLAKTKVANMIADTLWKQASVQKMIADINIDRAKVLIMLQELQVKKDALKLDQKELEAQIDQWAFENGYKEKEMRLRIGQSIAAGWLAMRKQNRDNLLKIVDILWPFGSAGGNVDMPNASMDLNAAFSY